METSKIPTAYELYHNSIENPTNDMIEFARLHVTAALEAAAKDCNYPYKTVYGDECNVPDIILSAYPLDNIK